jgi:hypothetical protein
MVMVLKIRITFYSILFYSIPVELAEIFHLHPVA